jgi:DNA-binding transcriptional LysR family regulator
VLQPARVQPAKVIAIPLTESIVDMVSAGLGVALLAQWAARRYVASGRIVARPVKKSGFRRQWYAATLRSQPVTPYMTEFLNLMSRASMGGAA